MFKKALFFELTDGGWSGASPSQLLSIIPKHELEQVIPSHLQLLVRKLLFTDLALYTAQIRQNREARYYFRFHFSAFLTGFGIGTFLNTIMGKNIPITIDLLEFYKHTSKTSNKYIGLFNNKISLYQCMGLFNLVLMFFLIKISFQKAKKQYTTGSCRGFEKIFAYSSFFSFTILITLIPVTYLVYKIIKEMADNPGVKVITLGGQNLSLLYHLTHSPVLYFQLAMILGVYVYMEELSVNQCVKSINSLYYKVAEQLHKIVDLLGFNKQLPPASPKIIVPDVIQSVDHLPSTVVEATTNPVISEGRMIY